MTDSNKFKQHYQNLNSHQRPAVDIIDGPVLVLAGPGTGKTQVLVLRIANILYKTQMNPYNILCLTFTESSAHETRERLIKIIGTSAYDVEINTFHSFANSIIKEFPYAFNSMLNEEGENELINYQLLDDFSRFKIIEDLLIKNHWDHLAPLKKNLVHLNQISKHIQDFKRERIKPDFLDIQASKRIKDLKILFNDEKINKTQKASLDIEIHKAKRTLELCQLYKLYNFELARSSRYDYEDMINWVVDALKSDPELALIYQEKYQYILIDEFQDTNNAQLELLNELTSFYKDNPNLFVVGDPNQSIYRFQGASNYNIEQFNDKYKNAKVIYLTKNYRSGQCIVDAGISVINNNQATINQITESGKKATIELAIYLHKEQEIYDIALKIKTLIGKKMKVSDIAILVRNNNQIPNFVNALNLQKIPFQVIKGDKVLNNPFIEKILLLIDVIIDPSDKIKFIQLLYFYRSNFTLKDAEIIKKAIFKNKKIIGLSCDAKIFLQKIEDLSSRISEMPLSNALAEIFDKFGILKDILKLNDRLEKLNLAKSLFNAAKKETISLLEWLEKLRNMQTYNLDLPSEPILYGEQEAVVISTVHQAKGKEYKVVFLPQMQQNIWSKVNRSIFYIPPLDRAIDENENQIQEERRLFYVGITRAKTSVYISFSKLDNEREITASLYTLELPPSIKIINQSENETQTIKRVSTQLLPTPKLTLSQLETAWLKEIVSKQSLSPTSFTTYKNCPKNYLIKNILRVPQVKSPSQSYGTAIHSALENYFLSYQRTTTLPELDELLGYYKNALDNEFQLSEPEKEKFKNDGNNLLTNYYNQKSPGLQIPIKTEYVFMGIYLDDIPLSGKVDKIEWLDPSKKTVRLIDYKTGYVKTRHSLLGLTKDRDTDYLFQLKFYQLLSELDHKFYLKWKIGESTLEFFDSGGKFTRESFTFTQTEIDELKNEIKKVWKNIQSLNFEHNPKTKHPCGYCSMIN